jgi:hypothetical protein
MINSPAVAKTTTNGDEGLAIAKVQSEITNGIEMVDRAIATLSKGLDQMSQEEKTLFFQYYDPANTGEINDAFVDQVLHNYQKMRDRLDQEIVLHYVPDNGKCQLMTLYYTDFSDVYVCPYVLKEANSLRIARSFVHEIAHMALHVYDRAYFTADRAAYDKLTPWGHPSAQLPLVGPVLREILRGDTLYHPDAYAHFAVSLVTIETVGQTEEQIDKQGELFYSISPEVNK